MIVIVDANIIFSTLIRPQSLIARIIIEQQDRVILIAPEFLRKEIYKHSPRIGKYLHLETDETIELIEHVFSIIHFYPDEILPQEIINHAMSLTDDIDQKDMVYIGFALFFNCRLWSGDKKLIEGIESKGFDLFVKLN